MNTFTETELLLRTAIIAAFPQNSRTLVSTEEFSSLYRLLLCDVF